MTIDDQLRDFARRADQHQQVITVEEIVQRAASHSSGSSVPRSRFSDRRKVLKHTPAPFPEEDATMIDLHTDVPTETPRKWPRRFIIAGLVAAAAVLAIVVVAVREEEPASPIDQPSTTVTVPPPALFGASDRSLAAGTYVVDRVEGAPTRPILITVGDGWSTFLDGWGIYKGEGQIMTFSRPDRVFVDACHPSDGDHPGPLTTLDGVVTALIEQRGWADVTTPADISIDGYTGKAFERTAPHSLSGCPADFESWLGPTGTSVYPPGDTVTDWVLDLDGTIVVLETRVNAGQAAEAHTELATILDSIHIAQP